MKRDARRLLKLSFEDLEPRQLFDAGGSARDALKASAAGPWAIMSSTTTFDVVGRVVDASGRGVAGIRVSLGDGGSRRTAATGPRGYFKLDAVDAASAALPLLVNGAGSAEDGRFARIAGTLSQFADHADSSRGIEAAKSPRRTEHVRVVLPRVDAAHAVRMRPAISRPMDLVNPALPGFAIHVPARGAIGPKGRAYSGQVALTVFNAPSGEAAVQIAAKGLRFRTPVGVTLPNSAGAEAGALRTLRVMTGDGRVVVTGLLQVAQDGSTLETIAGGISGPCTVLAPGLLETTPSKPESPADAWYSVAVGSRLDVAPGWVGPAKVDDGYTITPQPLPANMLFNRETGELSFTPAPGQAGSYSFLVKWSVDGVANSRRLHVSAASSRSSETTVSGRVVDDAGRPLSGMPVSIDGRNSFTDDQGVFSIPTSSAKPGPIRVGGALAQALDLLPLTAPVVDLLGHPVYDRAVNVMPSPLILPRIAWSTPVSVRLADASIAEAVDPAMPGFRIRPVATDGRAAARSLSVSTADLSADLARQHLASGNLSGPMVLYRVKGLEAGQAAYLTIPNRWGYHPGATLDFYTFNNQTGGRDVTGRMVVSDDGLTATTTEAVVLRPGSASVSNPASVTALTDVVTEACVILGPSPSDLNSAQSCNCPTTGGGVAPSPTGDVYRTQNGNGVWAGPPTRSSSFWAGGSSGGGSGILNSDVSLIDGSFFEDHSTPAYQSLGGSWSVDLQYISVEADSRPVVMAQFTTPTAGTSSSITSVTAQISLAGVSQGSAVTFNTPSGLVNDKTYYIPLRVDASALSSGVYPFTMTIVENFGSGSGSTSLTNTLNGHVDVVNRTSGAYGAGWSVGGLQKIEVGSSGGAALVLDGQSGSQRFNPVYSSGQDYVQDLALATSATSASILANDGAGGFDASGATYGAAAGVAAADFDGDGRPDQAIVTAATLGILLNDGLGGFTSEGTIWLPSGYAARAVAAGNFTGHVGSVQDLAVLLAPTSGSGGYEVAVYQGAGDGTFGSATTTSVGNGGTATSGSDSMIAGDFNGDGKADLAFATADGHLDVMLASTGGSMGTATSLGLASGHTAVAVVAVDHDSDGDLDLVVESSAYLSGGGDIAFLSLFTGNGSGGFSSTSTYRTVAHPVPAVTGLVAGDFRGDGLEIGVLVHGDEPGLEVQYIDLVPLSSGGTWGLGVIHRMGNQFTASPGGNIVAADFNGTGKAGIAYTDGTGSIRFLLPQPDVDAMYPAGSLLVPDHVYQIGKLSVAPFTNHAATPGYRGHASSPSTLVHNTDGTWTRSYPDGTVLQFDSDGREASATDRNGNAVTYAYVPTGQPGAGALKTITDPVGLVTTLSYDSSGKLNKISDPAGRITTVTVDSNGNLTQFVDPDSAVTQYGYSTPSNHRITSHVNPNGRTATITYNSFGQMTSETLFDGTSTTNVVPATSRGLLAPGGSGTLSDSYKAAITDPNNHTTTLTFSWMGHPTKREDAAGGVTTYAYTRQGFLKSATDELGRTTSYTYDSLGRATSITRPSPYLFEEGGWGYGETVATIVYDPAYGVPTSVTDFRGLTTTYTLDSHGNILRRTDPDGYHEDWTYNSAGQVVTDSDRNGAVTTFSYNSLGRLTGVANPYGVGSYPVDVVHGGTATASSENNWGGEGAAQGFDGSSATKWLAFSTTGWLAYQFAGGAAYTITQYTMTSANDTATFTGRAPKDWQLQGSNDGSTWTTVDSRTNQADTANFHATTFTVASPGSYSRYRLNVTANNGDSSYIQLAELRLIASIASPVSVAASSTSYGYDSAGNLTSYTDELGHASYFTYDAVGRVLTTQDPVQAAAGSSVKTSFAYDAAGNLTSVTDALGHVVSFAYDYRDRLVSRTAPVDQGTSRRTTFVYDGVNLVAAIDPLGHAVSYSYDAVNRPTAVVDPLGHATTTVYDLAGQVTAVIDPLGHAVSYTYDGLGRLKSVLAPSDDWWSAGITVAQYEYDSDDNVTQATDALGHATTFAYDSLNRRVGSTDALGHATAVEYDPAGHALASIDALGHATRYAYDARGRLVSQTAPAGGGTTTFTYDAASRLTSLADPVGNVTSWSRDAVGRVLAETDPLSHVTSYSYDDVGNPTQKTDRLGRATQFVYDADDRPVTEKWIPAGGGSPTNTITHTYDAAGRTTQVEDAVSKYAYTHDDADRLLTVDDAGTAGLPQVTLTYGYDDVGNRISLDDSLGGLTSYSYDVRDELTSITQSGSGVTAKRADYEYDAAMRLTTLTRFSDLSGSTVVLKTRYSYDSADRLTTLSHQTSGGTVRVEYGYALDAADRLTGESRVWGSGASSDTLTYAYTNDGQLASASHSNTSFADETFGYDANGNRNTSGYSTATGNRVSTDGVYNYAYDDEGNTTSKTEISTGDQTSYSWDHRNRLTEVDRKVGATTTVLATFTYDALDRRIGEKAGSSVRWTLYDGYSPVLDFNGSGTQVARYVQGLDGVLARETSGGVAWYLPDRLGTVRDLADGSGAVIDHVDYGAFGGVIAESAPSSGDRLVGFAQLDRDTAAELNLAIHRAQDPATGRWLSEDPIGFGGGDPDLYRHVSNRPTLLKDPSGLDVWIEGSSPEKNPDGTQIEPSGHISICIGDPNGKYKSFSFGADKPQASDFWWWVIAQHTPGGVYEDTYGGGEIWDDYHILLSAEEDKWLALSFKIYMDNSKKGTNSYNLFTNNCRTWTFSAWEHILATLKEYDIAHVGPPRPRVPKPPVPPVKVPPKGGTTGTRRGPGAGVAAQIKEQN